MHLTLIYKPFIFYTNLSICNGTVFSIERIIPLMSPGIQEYYVHVYHKKTPYFMMTSVWK